MARPKTKEDLLSESKKGFEQLQNFISGMSEKELNTEFDFTSLNKSEAHWKRDKNLRDVLIHLYEWQQLLIVWLNNNIVGKNTQFLLEGYNWGNYGEMNMLFFERNQNVSLESAKEMLNNSHNEVMKLIENFSTEQLFNKNVYDFVGGSTLGQYFISTTVAHYEWAIKKLKAHKKIVLS